MSRKYLITYKTVSTLLPIMSKMMSTVTEEIIIVDKGLVFDDQPGTNSVEGHKQFHE